MSNDAIASSGEDFSIIDNHQKKSKQKLEKHQKPKNYISQDNSLLSYSDSNSYSSNDDCIIIDENHRNTAKSNAKYVNKFSSSDAEEFHSLSKKTDQPVINTYNNKKLKIPTELSTKLYAHQHEGVQWLYKLYQDGKKGGILADDMGLGKTIQIISYISSMMKLGLIKKVLLVLPKVLVANWRNEFAKWADNIQVLSYLGHPKERKKALMQVKDTECVCLTTYGLARIEFKELARVVWDYTVLDEGHLIKNDSKTSKAMHSVPSKNRILLTGTPLQNKLVDLWALISWATQKQLLGSKTFFKNRYQFTIEVARQKGANKTEIAKGNNRAEELKKITEPYILRRSKESVTKESKVTIKSDIGKKLNCAIFPKLERKNDFVCWCYLSDFQKQIYEDFLTLPETKIILNSKQSALAEISVLKQICNHPRILAKNNCNKLGFNVDTQQNFSTTNSIDNINNIPDSKLLQESGKLQFLVELLEQLRACGHRTTVFSWSRKMLDIIEKVLVNRNYKLMRLDGTVNSINDRENIINTFQNDDSYTVFLLTAQVGGVGLTLTGADRAVIYDPSWNPSGDNQSVDRIYRIGQKKEVIVYRLITCGSIEEKIYQRQVYKESYIKQTINNEGDLYRYFSSEQLKKLVYLHDTNESVTQKQLQKKHSAQRNWSKAVSREVDALKNLNFSGVSENGLLFSLAADDFDPNFVVTDVPMQQNHLILTSEKDDEHHECCNYGFKEAEHLKTENNRKENVVNNPQAMFNKFKTYQKTAQYNKTLPNNAIGMRNKTLQRTIPKGNDTLKNQKVEVSRNFAEQDIVGDILGLMNKKESIRVESFKNKTLSNENTFRVKNALKLPKSMHSLSNQSNKTVRSETNRSLFNKKYPYKQSSQHSQTPKGLSFEAMMKRQDAANIFNKDKATQHANISTKSNLNSKDSNKRMSTVNYSRVLKKNCSENNRPSFFNSLLKPVNDQTLRKKRLAAISKKENGKKTRKV